MAHRDAVRTDSQILARHIHVDVDKVNHLSGLAAVPISGTCATVTTAHGYSCSQSSRTCSRFDFDRDFFYQTNPWSVRALLNTAEFLHWVHSKEVWQEIVIAERGKPGGRHIEGVTTIARTIADAQRCDALMAQDQEVTSALDLDRGFAEFADALYRFIRVRVGGNREAADELFQECFVQAARTGRGPTSGDAVPAWLTGIARNLTRRYWRVQASERRKRRGFEVGHGRQLAMRWVDEVLPDQAVSNQELVAELMLAVHQLPERDQRLILGRYFDGHSLAQLAVELRVTEKAVEAGLYRARERLRSRLNG